MKVYKVVVDRDFITTKPSEMPVLEIRREVYRYAADSMQAVWDAIDWLRNDPECVILSLIEEAPEIIVLKEDSNKLNDDEYADSEGICYKHDKHCCWECYSSMMDKEIAKRKNCVVDNIKP